MKWYDTPQNIETMGRYLKHRGYDAWDFAAVLNHKDSEGATLLWINAQKWFAHEQELQRRFNEDAQRVLNS